MKIINHEVINKKFALQLAELLPRYIKGLDLKEIHKDDIVKDIISIWNDKELING